MPVFVVCTMERSHRRPRRRPNAQSSGLLSTGSGQRGSKGLSKTVQILTSKCFQNTYARCERTHCVRVCFDRETDDKRSSVGRSGKSERARVYKPARCMASRVFFFFFPPSPPLFSSRRHALLAPLGTRARSSFPSPFPVRDAGRPDVRATCYGRHFALINHCLRDQFGCQWYQSITRARVQCACTATTRGPNAAVFAIRLVRAPGPTQFIWKLLPSAAAAEHDVRAAPLAADDAFNLPVLPISLLLGSMLL